MEKFQKSTFTKKENPQFMTLGLFYKENVQTCVTRTLVVDSKMKNRWGEHRQHFEVTACHLSIAI